MFDEFDFEDDDLDVFFNQDDFVPGVSYPQDIEIMNDEESAKLAEKIKYFNESPLEEQMRLVRTTPEDISFINRPSPCLQILALKYDVNLIYSIDEPCSDAICAAFLCMDGSTIDIMSDFSDVNIDLTSLSEDQMIAVLSKDLDVLPFLTGVTEKVMKYISKRLTDIQKLACVKHAIYKSKKKKKNHKDIQEFKKNSWLN